MATSGEGPWSFTFFLPLRLPISTQFSPLVSGVVGSNPVGTEPWIGYINMNTCDTELGISGECEYELWMTFSLDVWKTWWYVPTHGWGGWNLRMPVAIETSSTSLLQLLKLDHLDLCESISHPISDKKQTCSLGSDLPTQLTYIARQKFGTPSCLSKISGS